jgi:hypothetical protein
LTRSEETAVAFREKNSNIPSNNASLSLAVNALIRLMAGALVAYRFTPCKQPESASGQWVVIGIEK